jgi:hypothetical protein
MAMMDGDPFTSFLNELQQQLSDPNSNLYLPRIVLEQQPPYDPYAAGGWDFGAIAPPEGTTLATSLCGAIGLAQPNPEIWIATPAATSPAPDFPLPVLTLTEVTVIGLANAKLTSLVPNPPNSFNLQATITFGLLSGTVTYGNNQSYTLSPNIVVSGRFKMSQSCCAITPPKTPGRSPRRSPSTTFRTRRSGISRRRPPSTHPGRRR